MPGWQEARVLSSNLPPSDSLLLILYPKIGDAKFSSFELENVYLVTFSTTAFIALPILASSDLSTISIWTSLSSWGNAGRNTNS
jgi:hypothetical protein